MRARGRRRHKRNNDNEEKRAEGEGFEPSSDPRARNGFRDRRIRPLCHPSEGTHRVPAGARSRLYATVMFCFIPAASWPGTVQ